MVIDLILAIAVGYGFFIGFSRGIIKTVFTILSVLFGLIAAFKFAPSMTNFLETTFNSTNALMFVAGFLLTFVLTMVLIRLFARGLEGIFQTININFINQVAGGIFLGIIMALLYSGILWFGDKSHLISDDTKQQSFTYHYLEKLPDQMWKAGKVLQPTLRDFWDHSVDFMDKLQEKSVERTESEPDIYDLEEDNKRDRR